MPWNETNAPDWDEPEINWTWRLLPKPDGFFPRLRLWFESWWTYLTIIIGNNYSLWNLGLMFIYPENADLYLQAVKSLFTNKGEDDEI